MTERASTLVWDLPVRIVHWSLAVLFCVSWWSAENGQMEWHYRSGIALLGLILFRLIWGFIGSDTARFSRFLRSPAELWRYLRNPATDGYSPGHNPAGGYSAVAMLTTLAMQVGTGLVAVDVDGIESGPLSHLVSFDQGRAAAAIHDACFALLQFLVIIHLVAIAVYTIRGRKLVSRMVTGRDRDSHACQSPLRFASVSRFLLALLVSASVAWWLASGAGL